MKKMTAVFAAIALTVGASVTAAPASASTGSQAVEGVSAYYRVDLGYMVGWQTPSNRSNIVSYTVTASTGQTCVAKGSTANKCVFPSRVIGYTGSYDFTVTTNLRSGVGGVSDASNIVGAATIPSSPLAVTAETVSNTQIDVAWIPASGTGNLSLYGYKVTYWETDQNGQPMGDTRQDVVVSDTFVSLDVAESTMYTINVAACNALGCNSANYWVHTATTPITSEIESIVFPTVIGGGSADTTCFESIYDANSGETALGSCGSVVADPSTYPVVDPTATEVSQTPLATKFAQRAVLTNFSSYYSLRTWGPIGISWFSRLTADSKSYTLGFTTDVNIWSKTPAVCEVVGDKIQLRSTGYCDIYAQVGGDNVWLPSNTVAKRIKITN